MNSVVSVLNGGAVSIFGILLSAAFCGILQNRKKNKWILLFTVFILVFQGGICCVFGVEAARYAYPLTVHVPLVLLLFFMTQKAGLALFSVLTAYLCCQLRRWLALLAAAMAGGLAGKQVGSVAFFELILTLPLFALLVHIISAERKQLPLGSAKQQWFFCLVPAIYYSFDYATMVYSDVLLSGNLIVVEFMPYMCCIIYLLFLVYHFKRELQKEQLYERNRSLDIQLLQSVREIAALRESQVLVRQHRHDLRHHLQYVSACIENAELEKAQAYIAGICQELETQKVRRYCENEVVNLILSAYVGWADKKGIPFKIQGNLSEQVSVSESDLCVLLSNALENAVHACEEVSQAGKEALLEVQFYEREDKFLLQIVNSCIGKVEFENDVPVSQRPGHGIGVQSICAIVKKYKGVYDFMVKDSRFILRLSIPFN